MDHIQMTDRQMRQKGVSMVEFLIYLALASGVILAAFTLFNRAQTSGNVQDTLRNVQDMRSATQAIAGSRGNYTNTSIIAQLSTAGGVPPQIEPAPGTFENAYGGSVDVVGNGTEFQIIFDGIPQEDCVRIASGSSDQGSSIVSITVNGTATTADSLPISGITASAQCTNPLSNNITWTYR